MDDLLKYLRDETQDCFIPKQGKDPRRKKRLDSRRKQNEATYLHFSNKRKPFSSNGVVEIREHLDTYEGYIHGKSSRLMMREKQTWLDET
jgi:hypothetical protein